MIEEDYQFTSSIDNLKPLWGRAFYNPDSNNLPLMVVQHGYLGSRLDVEYSARRIAQQGFFCVAIDTRGCGGSAGNHDDGGLEIMDIYDGIEAAVYNYAGMIDSQKISIIGYSNGGANTYYSVVRFPFMFCAAMPLFGIPDYGHWIDLVESLKEVAEIRSTMISAIGGIRTQFPDKYIVRNTNLAARNLNGTHLHIAYDESETRCPPVMNQVFIKSVSEIQRKNIFLHVSRTTDLNRWIHDYNKEGHLNEIEDLFIKDIKRNCQSRPIMPLQGELVVLGFIVTPLFTCILGSGEDAAAKLLYQFGTSQALFQFIPLTSDKTAKVKMILVMRKLARQHIELTINAQKQGILSSQISETIMCDIVSKVELKYLA